MARRKGISGKRPPGGSTIFVAGKTVRCSDFPCYEQVMATRRGMKALAAEMKTIANRVEALEREDVKLTKRVLEDIAGLKNQLEEYHTIQVNGGPPRRLKDVVLENWTLTRGVRASATFSTALSDWLKTRPILSKIFNTRVGVSFVTLVTVWTLLALLHSLGLDFDPWVIIKTILKIQ